MKKATVVLLMLLAYLHAFAGPGNEVLFVSGTVTDKQSHETLAGVEVRVKGTSIVTFTDFDGNFFLPDLPAGTYELQFHYVTYESSRIVTGDCGDCKSVSVELGQR
jgi:hypothetical protein